MWDMAVAFRRGVYLVVALRWAKLPEERCGLSYFVEHKLQKIVEFGLEEFQSIWIK